MLNKYSKLEKKIFHKGRFELNKNSIKEVKKIFYNTNILITGSCGSIGYPVVEEILKYNFNKIFLLDKDENSLTDLNRQIVLNQSYKIINKVNYICTDITTGCIDDLLVKNKINIYLNFAAVKHVRSEEEINSIKYMFKTNSDLFIPKQKHKLLKIIFSVSSDKAVYPSSLLGISKLFMEKKLYNYNKKFKNTSVCCTRFANVSFSNGSILKLIADRLDINEPFGVPNDIRRYFITHEEAKNLCLTSLLKKNHNKIIVPSLSLLGQNYLIRDLVYVIAKLKSKKIQILNTLKDKKKGNFVVFTKSNFTGQKLEEQLFFRDEDISFSKNNELIIVKFNNNIFTQKILNKIYKFNSITEVQKHLTKEISIYKKNSKSINLKINI